jgi:hypothetical protein
MAGWPQRSRFGRSSASNRIPPRSAAGTAWISRPATANYSKPFVSIASAAGAHLVPPSGIPLAPDLASTARNSHRARLYIRTERRAFQARQCAPTCAVPASGPHANA